MFCRTICRLGMVALCCFAMSRSASATWGSFVTMGTSTIIGDPSCAQVSSGKVVCGARNLQHAFVSNVFSGTAWGGWKVTSGTGVITSNPSCAGDGSGTVLCGARSATSTLVATVFNGTTWSPLSFRWRRAIFRTKLHRLRCGQNVMRGSKRSGWVDLHILQWHRVERLQDCYR